MSNEDKSNNFWPDYDDTTASFDSSSEGTGNQVGPYKLLSILGEGAFGIVYLAEQKRPVRRRVALKILKPGMDSKQVIARFEAERQALALLDHPNIAYVYDAGTTKTGRPYFAMEYVKGESITMHCDHRKLSIEYRLELFLQVCEAIQHAHQKGIIHRDIKPSNIMVAIVDEKPIPKIIDFGVAKAITQPLTERTLFTEQGQLVGTPEYMSPEQAEMTAQDIDTRSDIYSLGVLLYELLTGILPFDRKLLQEAAFSEILRIIREEDPPHPSKRLSSLGEEAHKVAESRRTELSTLTKRLRKELELIPLKAMRKERNYRYRSASELADDIQNYLSGAPLIAGPESSMYRLKKFVRKHKGLVAGATAVVASLLLGFIVSALLYMKAEQAREEEFTSRVQAEEKKNAALAVLELLKNMTDALVDPKRSSFAARSTARKVIEDALEKVGEEFEIESHTEASVREILANMYLQLSLPGVDAHLELAEPHLKRALEIHQQQLGDEHPDTLLDKDNLGVVYWKMGCYSEAESLLSNALETKRRVLGEEHPNTLQSMNNLGCMYIDQGEFDKAEPYLKRALELGRLMCGEEDASTRRSLQYLGLLYLRQGRYSEADALFEEDLKICRKVLGDDSIDDSIRLYWEGLKDLRELVLRYTRQGRLEEAETLLLKILETRRRVLGWEVVAANIDFYGFLLSAYERKGHYDKAASLAAKALEIRQRLWGDSHYATVGCMHHLADLYLKIERYAEAEQLLFKVFEFVKSGMEFRFTDEPRLMQKLVELYEAWGKPERAEKWRAKLPRKFKEMKRPLLVR